MIKEKKEEKMVRSYGKKWRNFLIRNWKVVTIDRDRWGGLLQLARTRPGLMCPDDDDDVVFTIDVYNSLKCVFIEQNVNLTFRLYSSITMFRSLFLVFRWAVLKFSNTDAYTWINNKSWQYLAAEYYININDGWYAVWMANRGAACHASK